MPTTSLAGDRSRRTRNPRDITGRRWAQQHAEEDAKRAAANIDINEVRRAAYLDGHSHGYEKGLSDGWDACVRALVAEGVLDPDEPGDDEAQADDETEGAA